MSAMSPRVPKFKAIVPVGMSRRMGEIVLSRDFQILCFCDPILTRIPRINHRSDFDAVLLQDVNPELLHSQRDKTAKCFRLPQFYFKTSQKGVNIGIFKPNSHNIGTRISYILPISTELCTTIQTTIYSSCVVQACVQQIQDSGRPPF